MSRYNKYLIKKTDNFDPGYFTAVYDEIQTIKEQTESLPSLKKAEILLSYLKGLPLQNDWIQANPEVVRLVTSGTIVNSRTLSLFDSCREFTAFRQQLETFVLAELASMSTATRT